MKTRLFLYLFLFALLFIIFQLVNAKRVNDFYNSKLKKMEDRETVYRDSIMQLQDEVLDLMYFNMEFNEDALSYFERDGHNPEALIPQIKDKIYEFNTAAGEHPLVPYASMTDNKMLINRVRLLNHKWIITDFTDGRYWGELMIKYEVTPEGEVVFELLDHLLYATPQN